MLDPVLNSPFFGLTLTAAAWCFGCWVQNKTRFLLCNPLLIAVALVIAVLSVFRIPYETYSIGGDFIKLMLGPVTAVLALNIYNQRDILKEHFLPVLAGCLVGSLTSVGSILALPYCSMWTRPLPPLSCPRASPPLSPWASRRATAAWPESRRRR